MKPLLLTAFLSCTLLAAEELPYEANWSSLRTHTMPQWMDGMKFGIYFHWGPQTIEHANPDKVMTLLEAIDQWHGDQFSAKAWVDLMQDAGAQFGGPVAWHGSGLLNWDSGITDWTSVHEGPHLNIVGELTNEIRKRGLKILTSFHNNKSIWGTVSKTDPTYLDPTAGESPQYTSNQGRRSQKLLEGWYARVTEAIDKYQPDMVWVDTSFGGSVGSELQGHSREGRLLPDGDNAIGTLSEGIQQRMLAHYFNQAHAKGKEVEFIYKSFDIPPGIGMRDIEDGSLQGLQYDPWMADINMSLNHDPKDAWFFNPANRMKESNTLVDLLVDMTSKNGRMLLSVPPKPDGTFSEEQHAKLRAIGAWLKINGDAIYGTVPWTFFGEGPTEETRPGHHAHGLWAEKDKFIPQFTKDDIRFTRKDHTLYAICLDWPGKELRIRTLGHAGKLYPGDIKSVSLLGSSEKLQWRHTADALVVEFPGTPPCEFAYALKIELQ